VPTLEVVLEVCVVVVLVCVYLPVGFIECTRARTDVAGRRRAVEFFRGARAHATFSSCIALSIRFRWFRENSAFGYGGGEIRVVVVDFTGLSLVTRSPARWSLLVFDTRARVRSSHTIHRPSTCEWFRPNAPYRLLCEPRERDFLDVALGRVRRRRSHSSQEATTDPFLPVDAVGDAPRRARGRVTRDGICPKSERAHRAPAVAFRHHARTAFARVPSHITLKMTPTAKRTHDRSLADTESARTRVNDCTRE